jgi:HK97 family phage portal protein
MRLNSLNCSAATLAGLRPEQRSALELGHPRDPALAEWFGGGGTSAGVAVNPTTAMRQTAVYACVGLLADTIASLPLDLYEEMPDGSKRRATDHSLDGILHDDPNPSDTSMEWRQELVIHMALRGNAYSAIVQDPRSGEIEALVTLHPDRTRPFRFVDAAGARRVGYDYQPIDGPRMVLTDREVLHFRRRPFTADGLRGTSPIDLHRETIGLALAAQQYGAAFYGNNATPKGALTVPGKLTDEARAALREDWERRHRGAGNAHRLAIFDAGFTYAPIGMTNEQAQFLENRRFDITDIARLFGTPPHMVGETSSSTSWGTGIEQQSIGFVVYVIRAWLELIEQRMQKMLLLPRERGRFCIEHNVAGLLRGDFKTRIEAYALMIQWSIATPNQIRRLENWPAVAGGDELLQPLNMVPASKALEILMSTRQPSQARLWGELKTLLAASPELGAGGERGLVLTSAAIDLLQRGASAEDLLETFTKRLAA